jgi:hypothetical protein
MEETLNIFKEETLNIFGQITKEEAKEMARVWREKGSIDLAGYLHRLEGSSLVEETIKTLLVSFGEDAVVKWIKTL